jgi:chemotaxis protein CheD
VTSSATASQLSSHAKPACEPAVYSLGIAEIRVVRAPERIRTVLGSCVGVALYDRASGIGGMAHVMLPDSTQGTGQPGKFADTAVELLLEQVTKAGADPGRLRAKIAGGAAMFGEASMGNLGDRNAEAVRTRLQLRGVRVAGSALGGTKGRKMSLDPATGDVVVQIIGQPEEVI